MKQLEIQVNSLRPLQGTGRKLYIETYGCQMNVGDSEIVVSLMQREGYVHTEHIEQADVTPDMSTEEIEARREEFFDAG